MIVIDFIDMERARHRQRVLKAFEDALKRDRQKTRIMHLSPLGLVEMTRKRRGESHLGILTQTCPHCAGLGRVRNNLTVALKAGREIRRLAAEKRINAFVIKAAPPVASILVGEAGQRAASLEKAISGRVYIRADDHLGNEAYEVVPTTAARAAELVRLYARGDEVIVDHLDPREPGADEIAAGWSEGYRVEIEGGVAGREPQTVILKQDGRSFGQGQVKTEKSEREAKPGPRPRRRGRRKRSAAAKAQVEAEPAASGSAEAQPEAKEKSVPPAEAPPAGPPPPPKEDAPASARKGLLRRGARRMLRSRR
jgi:ribonuclease G